ncbi:unnamed protein product [Arctogadus glacialis]
MTSSKHHLPCGVVCHKQPGSQQQEDPPPHPYQGREVEGVATSWVSTYPRISFVSYPTPQPFSRRLTGVSSSTSLPQIMVDFYHCAIKGFLLGSTSLWRQLPYASPAPHKSAGGTGRRQFDLLPSGRRCRTLFSFNSRFRDSSLPAAVPLNPHTPSLAPPA